MPGPIYIDGSSGGSAAASVTSFSRSIAVPPTADFMLVCISINASGDGSVDLATVLWSGANLAAQQVNGDTQAGGGVGVRTTLFAWVNPGTPGGNRILSATFTAAAGFSYVVAFYRFVDASTTVAGPYGGTATGTTAALTATATTVVNDLVIGVYGQISASTDTAIAVGSGLTQRQRADYLDGSNNVITTILADRFATAISTSASFSGTAGQNRVVVAAPFTPCIPPTSGTRVTGLPCGPVATTEMSSD